MKTLINCIVLLTLWLGLPAQAGNLPTVKNFKLEAVEAGKLQIPILVLFMSSSCHYCEIVLDDFLVPMQSDPEFQGKVILRQIETGSHDVLYDFEGKQTTQSQFAGRLKVWGVPQVFLFDHKGNVLNKIVGLLTVDYYYAYLDDAIKESIAKIRKQSRP